MSGYPKHILGTSSSFTSGYLWQRFASVGTQHLAPFGQPWLLGNDPRPAIGCSPDALTPTAALGWTATIEVHGNTRFHPS